MKTKYKIKRKNKMNITKLTILFIFPIMALIGIGYSMFSTTLRINGTVVAHKKSLADYDYAIIDNGGTTVTINSDFFTSAIKITEILDKEFSGINATEKYIDRIDVTTTYTTKTGSVQHVVCMLTVNGTEYHQTMTFNGKQQNVKGTISFTNLHINPNDSFTVVFEDNGGTTNKSIDISAQAITAYLATL